jgi:hypothetical protein
MPIRKIWLKQTQGKLFGGDDAMKNKVLMTLGACCVLLGIAASADDDDKSEATSGNGDIEGAEQQSGAVGGATSGASGTGTKPASTATAVGAVNKAVKEGKIKIEGGTDPGAPGF